MAESAVVQSPSSDLDEAFPNVNPGVEPCGSRVLVQIRTPKKISRGGIILTGDTRDTEKDNTQVAKVIAVGSLAFKNRNTMEEWKEGAWVKPGEFIRAPKYGGDRWDVKVNNDGDVVTFAIFDDLNIIGKVTGDPLAMKAFI